LKLSPAAKEIVNLSRRHRLTYRELIRASADARTYLKLKRPNEGRKLPHLLTDEQLKRFYSVIDNVGNLRDQIMLRLLFYTGIRVNELVSIRMGDVDLTQCKIYIESGKGDKDRYILFPEGFRLTIQTYIQTYLWRGVKGVRVDVGSTYLFESQLHKQLTTRRVQQIVQYYAAAAEIPTHVHPHLLRHQLLTYLTKEGVPDSAIQLISGHASKKSLERYQHIGLGDVAGKYQDAVRKLEI
jgi:integrase/recombinase XerD